MNSQRRVMVCGAVLLFLCLSAAAQATPQETEAERMTLNLPEVTLGGFLKIVTEKSGMKMITTADLAKKPIAVYLPSVTTEEALDAVCAVYDLHWVRQPGTDIVIVKEADIDYFALENVSAKDVQNLVSTLVGSGGQVSADERNNVLAVRSGRQGLAKVRTMIAQIDATPTQVLIEATIAELSDDAQEYLGIRWSVDATVQGGARETELPFSRKLVPAAVSDTAWTYGTVSFQNFQARLQAMKTDNKGRILANPRIATLDGKEAVIRIVTNQVIAEKLTRSEDGFQLVSTEPIRADVGVTLQITPTVHPNKEVTLVVEPTVISAAASAFFSEAVDTFERSAKTTIRMHDGQTIALGGLLREENIEIIRKVPFLGDIPLLGKLFSHKETTGRGTELVVFLTLRVLDAETLAQETAKRKEWLDSKVIVVSKEEGGEK